MPRPILPEAQIHPRAREIASYRSDVLKEVQARWRRTTSSCRHADDPFPGKARKALMPPGSRTSTSSTQLFGEWRRRLSSRCGPAGPLSMVFVKGVLVPARRMSRLIAKESWEEAVVPSNHPPASRAPPQERRDDSGSAEGVAPNVSDVAECVRDA